MFTLADKFAFDPDPKMCFLSAGMGYSGSASLSWDLKLHSMAVYTPLIPPEDRAPGYDKVAFGIECHDLAFEIADWTLLAHKKVDVPVTSLSCAFSVFDWEDLISLSLKFGQTRSDEIEVFADGIGGAESMPELFPNGEVSFSVHTWARFTGVSINVPVNENDFGAYAQMQLRKLLPGFRYGEPMIRCAVDEAGQLRLTTVPVKTLSPTRRAADEAGHLRSVEVFYPPLTS